MGFSDLLMPADSERWLERMLAGARAMEDVLGITLARAHGGTKFHPTSRTVTDRRKFLAQRLKTKNRWFSLYCGHGFRGYLEGPEHLDYHLFGGSMCAHPEVFKIAILTPRLSSETAEKLVIAVGDALEIDSTQYTPEPAAARMRLAHWRPRLGDREFPAHPLEDRTEAEARLPTIYEDYGRRLEPERPHHFGWLNYWSPAVCSAVEFDRRVSSAPAFLDSRLTLRGARVVKLGNHYPVALDGEFVAKLHAAYDAFPGVGIRR